MKHQNKIRILPAIILAICIPISAVNASSLVISKVKNTDSNNNQNWFRFYENPGANITDSIILMNPSKEVQDLKIYVTDATSNQAGSFTPKMPNEEQKGIGAWTSISQENLILNPGEQKEVEFTIHLPNDVPPGQYFGSIMNESSKSLESCPTESVTDNQCKSNIQIKTRTGNRIYLNIPGEIKQDIKLNSFDWSKTNNNSINFNFNITNSGNVAFQPKATINIYNSWGKKIDSIEGSLGKSLPNTTITPIVNWDTKGQFGNFSAKVNLIYLQEDLGQIDSLHGTPLTETVNLKFYIIPWNIILILLLILISISFSIVYRKLHLKNLIKNSIDYKVKENENLMDIANKYSTNWKIIAKLNKITPPYILKVKQKLKIPQNKK